MTWYDVLILCSVPTIFSILWQFVFSKIGDTGKRKKSLEKGVQALLRDRLMSEYKYHISKGEISMADRDNYSNMYECYHALYENGVMTDYYKQVMSLPVVP